MNNLINVSEAAHLDHMFPIATLLDQSLKKIRDLECQLVIANERARNAERMAHIVSTTQAMANFPPDAIVGDASSLAQAWAQLEHHFLVVAHLIRGDPGALLQANFEHLDGAQRRAMSAQ